MDMSSANSLRPLFAGYPFQGASSSETNQYLVPNKYLCTSNITEPLIRLQDKDASTSSEASSSTADRCPITFASRSWKWRPVECAPASFPVNCASPTAASRRSSTGTRKRDRSGRGSLGDRSPRSPPRRSRPGSTSCARRIPEFSVGKYARS